MTTPESMFDAVIEGGSRMFKLVAATLTRQGVPWCVHGGFAVNCWATPPLYAPDVWIVVPASALAPILADLAHQGFDVPAFHDGGATAPGHPGAHRLRVRFDTQPRYQGFPQRASLRPIWGETVPVAGLVDTVTGLLWAAADPDRSLIQTSKAELDALRLAVAYPAQVDGLLPDHLRRKAEAERAHVAAYPEGDGWGEDDAPTMCPDGDGWG